jgi:predicted NodU family carbamoyl transferase
MLTKEITEALEFLHKAEDEWKAMCIKKYGKFVYDNNLYCDIVGPAWKHYLSVGGSRSMINN